MASTINMKLRGGALLQYWRSFKPADFRTAVQRRMFEAVSIMHTDLARNSFSGKVVRSGMFTSSAPGNQLAARTGSTRSRLTHEVLTRGSTVVGVVGSPDRHVLANEKGATITPKKGKMLAIPTNTILTPTGALKNEWAAKLAGGGWRGIWDAEGLFVWRGKRRGSSGAWIARTKPGTAGPAVRGAGGKFKSTRKLELLAYLTPSVTLVPRHMLRTSARRVAPRVAAVLGVGVKEAITTVAR
jgi:hypothetical protein